MAAQRLSDRHLAEIGLLFALIGIGGIGVPMIWPDGKIIGAVFILAGAVGALAIFSIWVARAFGRPFFDRQKMAALVGMIVFGIGFFLCAALYFWPSKETTEWSWNWDPLTKQQQNDLFVELNKLPKQPIALVCTDSTCDSIEASYKELFARLDWPFATQFPAQVLSRTAPPGESGIFISPESEHASSLKKALEEAASVKVTVSKSTYPYALVFGTKPLPPVLPQQLQAELKEIGKAFVKLSEEIAEFAIDRNREAARTLPQRTSEDQIFEHALRQSDFRRDTENLLQIKYGSKITALQVRAVPFGIKAAWQVSTGGGYQPELWSKWFRSVGELMVDGRTSDARRIAADNDFWFRQR